MQPLRIQLFGSMSASAVDSQPLDLGSPTTKSLLAYLILHHQQPIDRRRLAFIFWPRSSESASRRNLRQYLHRLRRALEPVDPDGELVQTDGTNLWLALPESWWVDVHKFEAAATPPNEELGQAIQLYSGQLLPEVYEGWVDGERERLHHLYLSTLAKHADQLKHADQIPEAIEAAYRYLAAEPFMESAHLRIMTLYNLQGNRERIQSQFDELSTLLMDEFGAEPLSGTIDAFNQMMDGTYGIVDTGAVVSPELQQPKQTDIAGPDLVDYLGDRGEALSQTNSKILSPTEKNVDELKQKPPFYFVHEKKNSALPEVFSTLNASNRTSGIADPSNPPLVGRRRDLQCLEQHFSTMMQGTGQLLLIQGEMGIGKTRLISEWMAQLPADVYRFEGRSREFESVIPYAPLTHAFQELSGDCGENQSFLQSTSQRLNSGFRAEQYLEENLWSLFEPTPPWLASLLPVIPHLAEHFPSLNVPAATQFHTIQGLCQFFLTLARHRPVVLFVDNLHWADNGTWSFLSYMAQQITRSQILIVGSARIGDLSEDTQRLTRRMAQDPSATLHALERLSLEETAVLVHQVMADDDLDSQRIRRLYEETEGNPFFVVETLRSIQDSGGDWSAVVPTDDFGQRPTFAIPLKIQSVIEARLDQLDEESRLALCMAAAIGREFSFELLQQISQIEPETLLDALDEWLNRSLVRESNNRYDFTHEKLSQVAYNQLSQARRHHIHLQIANRLSDQNPPPEPAQLAHHYYRSSDPVKGLPYLTQAGQRALNIRSYSAAREYGLQAISLSGRFPIHRDPIARIDLNLQLAQAYAFSQQLDKALALLRETERIATQQGDMERLAQIFHRSSQLLWLSGQPDAASSYARRTLRHAEELDDASLRFGALRMIGRTYFTLSQFDDAISYLLRHLDLVKQVVTPPAGLPVVYGYLGTAYARVGSWQRAIDAVERGVEMAEAEPAGAVHTVACMQKAFVYSELREWDAALRATEPIRQVWADEGMSPHAFMARCVLGKVLCYKGQIVQGLAEIRAALEWAEAVDHRVLTHISYLFLAQCYHMAESPKADAAARNALTKAETTNDQWAAAVCMRLIAEIDMRDPHQTDWQAAERYLLKAIEILRQIRARPDLAHAYLALRRLYDRAGHVGWAMDCHFRAVTIFEEAGMAAQLSEARGQAAGERTGAVVIPGLTLIGPVEGEV